MAELMTRIILRNDSTGNWTTADAQNGLILFKGEVGIEFATITVGETSKVVPKIKVGDGSTNWSRLDYATLTPDEIEAKVKEAKEAIPDLSGILSDYYTKTESNNTFATKETVTNITKEDGLIDQAKQAAISAASSDATAKANAAQAAAEATAAGDATAKANTAEANAKAYADEKDTFNIDMLTVNAHGGIAAGADLNGWTTHEILKKILYPYVEPSLGNATASPNGGTYEKGETKTITSVSISVTKKSEAITSVALYNGSTLIEEKTGDAVKNGGTFTFSDLSVVVPTNGNQLTVKVTDAAGKSYEKKTSSMTFVYPYYMGTCAAGTTIDETLVESLTKKIESKGNKSNSFTVSDGHMVFAYPKAHGVLKSILDPNNFETIGNYTRSEVSVTGLDGTAQTYYVYVSGATTVSSFTVNFKY
jgi:hypothetical protein